MIMGDNKLVVTTETKTFYFNLLKDTGINLIVQFILS